MKRTKKESMLLTEFFIEQMDNANFCENCGLHIYNPSGKNVEHILPKRIFKSVATNDRNVLYLCSTFDRSDGKTGCHEQYDSSWSKARTLPVFKLATERLGEFRDQVKEKSKIL